MILTVYQYRDRTEAAQVLARQLAHYASRVDALVLAISRDSVTIAAEVAAYLGAPLDAFFVRKLTLVGQPGLALGAVAPGGVRVLDHEAIRQSGLSAAEVDVLTAHESGELRRREESYRGRRAPLQLGGRVVILIDDGITNEWSMHAAVIAVHQKQPAWLVAAAPVGSPDACQDLANEVHEVVCPLRPEPLQAVGLWYDHFPPTREEDVRSCLRRSGTLAS